MPSFSYKSIEKINNYQVHLNPCNILPKTTVEDMVVLLIIMSCELPSFDFLSFSCLLFAWPLFLYSHPVFIFHMEITQYEFPFSYERYKYLLRNNE